MKLRAGFSISHLNLFTDYIGFASCTYDFGSGDCEYKELFATGELRCGELIYFAAHVLGSGLVCTHFGIKVLSEALKTFLDAAT